MEYQDYIFPSTAKQALPIAISNRSKSIFLIQDTHKNPLTVFGIDDNV